MSAQRSSPWTTGFQARRQSGNATPGMRVSDAERADVSDRLSKHYADGRLDQAEFDERVSRAMSAKTHGDFAGLFSDLPDFTDERGTEAPAAATPVRYRSHSPLYRIALVALIVVAAVAISHALVGNFVPWLLVGLVAFLLLRGRGQGNRI